jgi:aminoglycoside/choline kinase family phosphotransferase
MQELDELLQQIVETISKQPMVFSHMDYHSRNLMVLNKRKMPGILDFQDAMWAPCTLDLVSLLKDCYIYWPREQVVQWVHEFYQLKQAETAGALAVDFHVFLKWFDWTGVQRHLRILGTFSRLHYMYGKSSYLQYIPRILKDLLDMSEIYPELRSLQHFLR